LFRIELGRFSRSATVRSTESGAVEVAGPEPPSGSTGADAVHPTITGTQRRIIPRKARDQTMMDVCG
jgi:hypothetical protein